MKAIRCVPFVIGLVTFLASCGEDVKAKASDVVDSSKETLSQLGDLSKLSAEDMKKKAGEIVGMLQTKFESVKDEASAIDVRKTAEPLIQGLGSLKTALGDKMPSMADLSAALDRLESKFQGNESVMKVLRPLIDKARQLLH